MQEFMGEIATKRAHEPDKLSEGKPFNSLNRKGNIFI
jgi:hypothetical protein